MRKTFVSIVGFIIVHAAVFAGGPEGPIFSWSMAPTVKGGMRECIMSADSGDAELGPYKARATYDDKGRILTFEGQYGEFNSFVYAPSGGIAEILMGFKTETGEIALSGSKDVYTYDSKGRLAKIESFDEKGESYMSRVAFDYDPVGGYKLELPTYGEESYGYETYSKEGRLLEAVIYDSDPVSGKMDRSKAAGKTSYAYDKNGNLIQKTIDSAIAPGQEGAQKVTVKIAYQFDASGNKTVETTAVQIVPKGAMYFEPYFPKVSYAYSKTAKSVATAKPAATAKASPPTDKGLIGKAIQVEYEGEWYPATVLKTEGDKYYIHYTEYDSSWDEWVTKERIKF
jgi:hypothetical protein